MAVLNSWQRIDRVLTGLPFGDGRDGALTISADTTQSLTSDYFSGNAGNTQVNLGTPAAFANGDVVLLHQTRGTGVGQWEINKVASGGGTATLQMSQNLQYTYTSGGDSVPQILKIPMYTSVTVNGTKTWSGTTYNGLYEGFLLCAANNSITITGTARVIGSNGSTGTGTVAGATGGGFSGGATDNGSVPNASTQGDGSAGVKTASTAANGNGGGGAAVTGASNGAGGGGGGHASAGTTGTPEGASTAGTGGSQVGSSDLTTIFFGGGGGGGSDDGGGGDTTGSGGSGGGIVLFFAKDITVTGAVSVNGGNGGSASSGGGGGAGAGGSILLGVQTATLGSTLMTSLGGSASNSGGSGAAGRLAVHHSGTVTGTSNPSFTDVSDPTLVEVIASSDGPFFYFM